ncbi:hypothetical protein [Yoonia sediminilitoris]|uniref:Uncharacterized protein n=1 Tax=Yoonia sediminilitoris TaxID=1286148 RepID=A0A2T6K979_9RHOB|nr:hypothetical protein [Yoonia sediminilitoris]PUB11322.1 hypothetical protein C8N45_11497 [Yoonia sediminilitoris]RCW91139.1 hypothetical protein DFP92_11498 [Yoonia sediminilitoris]
MTKSTTCIKCGASFCAQRSTAKYCNPTCRKAMSRGGIPENRRTSPSQRRREDEFFDLHMRLCETYYGMPPADRPAYSMALIDRARAGESKIKRVLTNPLLLNASESSRVYNWRSSRAYPTIAQEAAKFSQDKWGVSIGHAVSGQTPTAMSQSNNKLKEDYDHFTC